MEILSFYSVNILAGSLLVFLLGYLGVNTVARNQSLDVMLLGQEFQTAILISALFLNVFINDQHDDHGFHLETLMSLSLVLIFHSGFARLLKNKNQYKVEAAIVGIVTLMALSQLVVALSPSIEFHMVKSFIGDIVTVSKNESVMVSIIAGICILILFKNNKIILKDSLEIALFNKVTIKKKSSYIYSLLLLFSMLFSIHLFGSLFTIGSILIPSFICTYMGLNIKEVQRLNFINWTSVPFSFYLLSYNDRIPTTVMIIAIITLLSLVYCLIRRPSS